MTQAQVQIPGYRTGTWTVDPVHSDVSFLARHMMVSKVRGTFGEFAATLTTAEDPAQSHVEATVQLASIDTRNEMRDNHIRSSDFLEVEKNPEMTFRSTGVRQDGDDFVVEGELTLKGVTKPVELQTEVNGFGPDAYGGYRAGFSARTSINRKEYGVAFNAVMEGGGVVVSDKIDILVEAEFVLDQPDAAQS